MTADQSGPDRSGNWQTYPSAPVGGSFVCRASDVPEGGSFSVDLAGFPILLARQTGQLVAYVNACPHQFLPLDYRSNQVISADGALLRCSVHEAGFDLRTGLGVEGPGSDCALDPVPVQQTPDGDIVIA